MTMIENSIDLSRPKRKYLRDEQNLSICPECGSDLIDENCTVLLYAKSDTDEGEFMTNHTGSHLCNNCPVVVLDKTALERAVLQGIRGTDNLIYRVEGIVNLAAIPESKKNLVIGSKDNPIPLVKFLPDLKKQSVIIPKKIGRNDPCTCGSGMKFKKCCGK